MKMQRRPAKARIKENAFSTMTLQLYYSVPILSPVNFVTAIWFILCNWTVRGKEKKKRKGASGLIYIGVAGEGRGGGEVSRRKA